MAVRKLRNTWWIDFSFDRIRYRKRSPDNSRAGAAAFELVLRERLAHSGSIERQDSTDTETFEEFAPTWFRDYVESNNRYSEQVAKRYVLRAHLIPFFGKTPIAQICAHDIERFKAQQVRDGFTNKTIKNRLTVLNKCLITAYEWLNLAGVPPKIKWPRCASYRTTYLSPDECELLLSHAEGILYELILMALRTGMRQGELKGLQWTSIDWHSRTVMVRYSLRDRGRVLEAPKNNRERPIPLDSDVYQLLYRKRQAEGFVFTDEHGQPYNEARLNRRLTRLCALAGIRRVTWHVLRHTFGTQLAIRGVPLHIVQTLLGHSSITTTMRYAHVAPSALRPAIEMLNPRQALSAELGQPTVNTWVETHRRDVTKDRQSPNYRLLAS